MMKPLVENSSGYFITPIQIGTNNKGKKPIKKPAPRLMYSTGITLNFKQTNSNNNPMILAGMGMLNSSCMNTPI